MKVSTALILSSSIAVGSAQYFEWQDANDYSCFDQGKVAYCAGGATIIRCSGGKGLAGNCNDDLSGMAHSDNTTLVGCYQSSAGAGDAACTKAGLVYPGTGSGSTNITAAYPIPGRGARLNITSTITPASQSTGVAGGVSYITVTETTTVNAGCGSETVAPSPTSTLAAAVAVAPGHFWGNGTNATISMIAVTGTAAPVVLSTAAPIATSISTDSASASASATYTSSPEGFKGAATRATGSASLALLAVVAYALL